MTMFVLADWQQTVQFDPLSLSQTGFVASEVDVSGREVLQALMIAPMVVMVDKGRVDSG